MMAIEVDKLCRTFSGKRVVDEITFSVEEGEVFGFLGPNGAGKTTTIRMLTGQLSPTGGRAQVVGYDILRHPGRIKASIGVVFEEQNLYERSSGRENLLFFAGLYGIPPRRVEQVLEQVGMSERAGDRVQKLSNGMRQRLVIARALLHTPRVLFLDEPTRGLDPTAAQEIRAVVKGLAQGGMTVFLTTHYMEEADQLCNRVAFLDRGRILALDTPERLKVAYGQRMLKVTCRDGSEIILCLDDQGDGQRLGELAGSGDVQTVHSAEASLEEVFIRLTGRRLTQ
jgi:ABC-2 type transport system ATP-binding protein